MKAFQRIQISVSGALHFACNNTCGDRINLPIDVGIEKIVLSFFPG